ncbi:hypothetical protein ASE01_23060 [Nocardioides sp. Root190]|uniref:acyl-CoA carboxylase subunit epsilon n=1 Tax=Nocardioides sp. Root190 TaxID=1736488 RepID=UPI0006FC99C9|nr:acyl-CoA carboxylase subunit epsilon [Nocardioides sp. Root190]KRB79613.1 hypothetical protein ASE01_23060 [Nocardioides sp. Root190]
MTNEIDTEPVVEAAPLLRIITPDTTPEEVAAIVAVLSALGGETPAEEPVPSEWASPARAVRTYPGRPAAHGRGAWRSSSLPR